MKLAAILMAVALPAIAPAAPSDVLHRSGFDSANLCAPDATSILVANVRNAPYGALGDGVSDDTAAIQRALDAVAGTGGTVLVPPGTYMINPTASPSGGNHGLRIGNRTTLQVQVGAVLKAFGTSAGTYAVLQVHAVSDVNIVGGGTIEGERGAHIGTDGEWGMGIDLGNASRVSIDNVAVRECWGDGVYIGNAPASTDISLCRVTADHNRRQGLSITNASGVTINRSEFSNTIGTPPASGIDLEPNTGQTVHDIAIQNSSFSNNAGGAFQTGVPVAFTGNAWCELVVFDHNVVNGNGIPAQNNSYEPALRITNSDGTQVTANTLSDNAGLGILLAYNASHSVVTGNTVQRTRVVGGYVSQTGTGILIGTAANSSITGNTVINNDGHGIYQSVSDASVTISANTMYGNGLVP